MTYYTCDSCEWAGDFGGTREHHDETGHDSFSKRDAAPPAPTPSPAPYLPNTHDQATCSHTFAWWGVIPPSRCILCGASLNRGWPNVRPYHPWNYPYTTRTWSSSTTAIDGTVTVNFRPDDGDEPMAFATA